VSCISVLRDMLLDRSLTSSTSFALPLKLRPNQNYK